MNSGKEEIDKFMKETKIINVYLRFSSHIYLNYMITN